jgi:predicted DNA-binding transcriptional regulator AlpA
MTLKFEEAASRLSIPNDRAISVDANLMVRRLDTAMRILRMKQLIERTGLGRSTLYGLIQSDPTFPRKIKLTARAIGFDSASVEAWLMLRVQASGESAQGEV